MNIIDFLYSNSNVSKSLVTCGEFVKTDKKTYLHLSSGSELKYDSSQLVWIYTGKDGRRVCNKGLRDTALNLLDSFDRLKVVVNAL